MFGVRFWGKIHPLIAEFKYIMTIKQIKTRKQAILDLENIYFTGKPCKNGHITYRYVQSGTCADCINSGRTIVASGAKINRDERLLAMAAAIKIKEPSQKAIRDERLLAMAQQLAIKNSAKSNLVEMDFRIYDEDYASFKMTVYATVILRYPELSEDDILSKKKPTGLVANTGLYYFNCHPEDIKLLRDVAATSISSRRADIEGFRKRSMQQIEAEANKEARERFNLF